MNISLAAGLLNALTAMLMVLQGAHAPSAVLAQAVNVAGQGVTIAAQATAQVPFAVPQNNGLWPNMADLRNAAYRDANGGWTRLGPKAELIQEDTSFGDLNGDGLDDAAVVVNKPDASGSPHYFLVAMLNQGGVMFDVAELPLGNGAAEISSHHITSGTIVLDGTQYRLLGIRLSAL